MLVLLLRDGVGVSNETVDNALVLFVDEPCLTEVSVEIKVHSYCNRHVVER